MCYIEKILTCSIGGYKIIIHLIFIFTHRYLKMKKKNINIMRYCKGSIVLFTQFAKHKST